MPVKVVGPDNREYQFPDGTTRDTAIAYFKKQGGGTQQKLQPTTAEPVVSPHPSVAKALETAGDLGTGAAKGVLNTVSGADEWAREHLPAFFTNSNFGFGKPADITALRAATVPTNTTQKVGKGVEQAAEYLIPGGAEEAAITRLGGGLAARAGARAVGAGLVNKAQGGSFTGGAVAGAAGEGIASGLRAVAPSVAKTAMGVRGADYARGRDPGTAILERTKGFSPGKVAEEAKTLNAVDTAELNQAARSSTVPVDLKPARDVADQFLDTAVRRNNPDTIRDVRAVGSQLLERQGTPLNTTIPQQVSAEDALELKRGIGDLRGTWDVTKSHELPKAAVEATYGAMQPGLAAAIPGYEGINSRLSSMIPVADRAAAKDLNAGILERTVGKIGRPTGALIGAAAGAAEGKREGGTPGAVIGGLTGLVAPEILTSPTTLMLGARGAYSPAVSKYLIPSAIGLTAQGTRKKEKK